MISLRFSASFPHRFIITNFHINLFPHSPCYTVLKELSFGNPMVTIQTKWINTKIFYVLPTQCIYVFCVDLRTNSNYFLHTVLTGWFL